MKHHPKPGDKDLEHLRVALGNVAKEVGTNTIVIMQDKYALVS